MLLVTSWKKKLLKINLIDKTSCCPKIQHTNINCFILSTFHVDKLKQICRIDKAELSVAEFIHDASTRGLFGQIICNSTA